MQLKTFLVTLFTKNNTKKYVKKEIKCYSEVVAGERKIIKYKRTVGKF